MKSGKIFTEEKILYFANQDQSFHVQSNEPKDSDCSRIVQSLHHRGMLTLIESSAGGRFFEITTTGQKRLLELQIKWRQSNGKDASEQQQKLEELRNGTL